MGSHPGAGLLCPPPAAVGFAYARAADMLMIGSAASEAKQRTVGDAINSFTDGMTTFDN